MSANSAPARRICRTSSTRLATVAFVALAALALARAACVVLLAFMAAHQVIDPRGVPVVQPGVVDQAELLPVPVAAEVGGAFESQPRSVLESQGHDLAVVAARGDPLAPLHEF